MISENIIDSWHGVTGSVVAVLLLLLNNDNRGQLLVPKLSSELCHSFYWR